MKNERHLDVPDTSSSTEEVLRSKDCLLEYLKLTREMVMTASHPDGWRFANGRLLQFAGITEGGSGNQGWSRVFKEEHVGALRNAIAETEHCEGASRQLECQMLRRDGAYRWCDVTVHRVSRALVDGEKWILTLVDIHPQKLSEMRTRRLQEELHSTAIERHTLVRKIIEAQEEERARIAGELHDQLGQCITALKLMLTAFSATDPLEERRKAVLDLLQNIERQVDQFAFTLKPYLLESSGVHAAISAFMRDWAGRYGIETEIEVGSNFPARMQNVVEVGLFRIILAALNNVVKHAGAKRVSVVLGRNASSVYAIVEDNGAGFDVERVLHDVKIRARSGATIMEQRAMLLGGTCTWESSRNSGTSVYIRIPNEVANISM